MMDKNRQKKSLKAIVKLQAAAKADLEMRKIVDKDTYKQVVEKQSSRTLAPTPRESMDRNEIFDPQAVPEGTRSVTFQQDNLRTRYSKQSAKKSTEDVKTELPQNHWGSSDLIRYEKGLLDGSETLRCQGEYPDTINLHQISHDWLNNLRERGLEGQSSHMLYGPKIGSYKMSYVIKRLHGKYEEYSTGNMAEEVQRLSQKKDLQIVGEAYLDVPGYLSRNLGHLLKLPEDHDSFPVEQLYRFLNYQKPVRPLHTTRVGKNENLMAFIAADTKFVNPVHTEGKYRLKKSDVFVSFNTQGPKPKDWRDTDWDKLLNITDSGLKLNAKIAGNHKIVIYTSRPNEALVKLDQKTLLRK